MEETSKRKRETVGEAVGKSLWLLIIPVAFFVASVIVSTRAVSYHLERSTLHDYDKKADLGLVTVASTRASENAGNGYEIPESVAVDDGYFSDALFFGDSITSGLTIYDMFENFNVVYKVGVNTHNAMTEEFTTTGTGEPMNMIEAVKYYSPRKLYIMLGTNGINWATTDWLLDGYRELVKAIMTENPDCMVILQSIPPVSESKSIENPSFSKENFHLYNDGIRQLAIELGCYFLDINAAFSTPDGYLDPSYAAPDGVHFGYAGYQRWHDYLITHTVQGGSVYRISDEGYVVKNT